MEVEVGRAIFHGGKAYPIPAFGREVMEILRCGGLVERMKACLLYTSCFPQKKFCLLH